jgi:hypothetical protein
LLTHSIVTGPFTNFPTLLHEYEGGVPKELFGQARPLNRRKKRPIFGPNHLTPHVLYKIFLNHDYVVLFYLKCRYLVLCTC